MQKKLMCVKEVADLMCVSTQRVYDLVRRSMIPAVRIGRQVRIDEEALVEWIDRGGQGLNDG